LLAGCGPLRAGEALGLTCQHVSKDFRTLYVRQKAKRGHIQTHLKTDAGLRDVDLCTELSELLREFLGNRTEGLVFPNIRGKQRLQTHILRDSLHPILAKLGLPQGGFNIFRRYRITHMRKARCPQELQNFWSGHSQENVSERYTKLEEERAYRLDWAERVGMGFTVRESQTTIHLVA